MHVKLRKIGKSTGFILPQAIVEEWKLPIGTKVEWAVKDGAIIATPIRDTPDGSRANPAH